MFRVFLPLFLLMLALPAQAACRLPADADTIRMAVLSAINAIRTDQGLAALTTDPRLQAAAQGHACDSATTGRMDHRSPDGRSMQDRIDAQGYDWREIAENVAMGQRSATEVVRAWLSSPPHRKNMMMPRAQDAGIGLALQADGKTHWVFNIGRSR